MVDTKPQTFQEVQAAIEAAFEDPEFVAELERKMAEVAAEMKEWERKRKTGTNRSVTTYATADHTHQS